MFVKIQGPPGATLQSMEKTSQAVSKIFVGQPEVENIFVQIGDSGDQGGGGSDPREGTVTIILDKHRHVTGNQIRDRLREQLLLIPDARVSFLDAFGSAGYQQVLAGNNGPNLEKASLQLEQQMRTLSIISDPRPSRPPVGPEIVITPRADEASRLGVSSAVIAQTARIATVGDIDANVAKLTDGERRVPIRVRLPADDRSDVERIDGLRVPTAGGGVTTLGAVADIDFKAGPARIDRLNRERQMTVNAELSGATLGQATNAVKNLPIMKNLPPGVHPAAVGDAEAMAEMFGAFGMAIFAGVAMIYGVLVLLFRSFFKPGVILSALPLAVGGAFLGLLITRQMLSMPSLIGFLMLLGLAAKNSILLVEYAIEQERNGATQRNALIEACRERARPIVMTTVAMAAGMMPTALALEKGSEFRQPMAVAVIGGLITSTILSLVLVPVVYEIADDFENWLKPKFSRFMTPRDATEGEDLTPAPAGAAIVQPRRGFRLPWSRN
jgi:HAE1 family hydrophobic/amphiphilic exporter-1